MKLTSQIALGILTSCIISCSFMREVDIYEPSKSISAFEKFLIKPFLQILKRMLCGE